MKILFHLNSMGHGGAERVVGILCSSFVQKGEEVVLATQWESQNEYPVDPRVRRIHVGLTERDTGKGRLAKMLTRYFRLRKCIRKEKPDIVISFCNKANFRCAFAMLGMNVPLLVSVRNDPVKDYAPYKIPTWYMQGKAAGCVFQTPDAMHFFSKKFQNKSRIIFNPLSGTFMETAGKGLPPAERKKEIVTAGRISRQKNQLLLLRAFCSVAGKFPEYRLKIYGAVQEKDVYRELCLYADENGLRDKVCFMGETDTLYDEIRDAAAFVLSSDYEGMPNALIEAMALGLPCIATDCPCGGPAVLIENNVSGILVPTGSQEALEKALCAVLSDPAMAGRMGGNAKGILEKVRPDKICEEWVAFIKEIVQK